MRPRFLLSFVALVVALLMPAVALAAPIEQADASESVVLLAPYTPVYRIVPPSTDPYRSLDGRVLGMSAVRGTLLHAEGDLALLALGEGGGEVVIRFPVEPGPNVLLAPGARVEALGLPTVEGILNSLQVTIFGQAASS